MADVADGENGTIVPQIGAGVSRASPMLASMTWLSGRVAFLTVLSGLVAVHLVAVTFAALPPNRYSNAVEPSTGYLGAYFAQNWRLFAPNPVAQDREVRFQVAYTDEAGDVVQSEWIDWTSIELDLVREKIVGGRAGYITNKMTSSLSSRYQALDDAQQEAIDRTDDEDPPSWDDLEEQLAGVPSAQRSSFLRYERAVVRLGSDIAAERMPDADLVSIRYSIAQQGVTPYSARTGSAAEREDARPNLTERLSGWRTPVVGPADERDSVGDFDARHR